MTFRLTPVRTVAAAMLLAAAGAATATTLAQGDPTPSRADVLASASVRFAPFARAQSAADRFTSSSADARNRAAAAAIAQTSRRLGETAGGDAYTFLDADNDVCVIWRSASSGVAGSSCGAVGRPTPPGVIIGSAGGHGPTTVISLVDEGVDQVTVQSPGLPDRTVPVVGGALIYQTSGTFTIRWSTPAGAVRTIKPPSFDVSDLKPTQ